MVHSSKKQLARSLQMLLDEFNRFSYENAGSNNPKGWLDDLSPSLESWQQRVQTTIDSHFIRGSAPRRNLELARGRPLRGNGPDGFLWAMARYQEALATALAAAQDDIHAELNSDRPLSDD